MCGAAAGLAGGLVYRLDFPAYWHPYTVLVISCALAAFIATLLMVSIGVQHPPAAALAIALAFDGNPLFTAAVALGCILIICLIKLAAMYLMTKSHIDGIFCGDEETRETQDTASGEEHGEQ